MLPALIGLGMAGVSAYQGYQQNKKSNQMQQRALEQTQREYDERAPLRRQGMQALGQVEAPMNLGNLGFNPSNPFAAARGPAPSTASYGDWGRMTTSTADTDAALMGATPDELQRAQSIMGTNYIGRSNGAMRFNSGPGTTEYTNRDREGAQAMIERARRSGVPSGLQGLGGRR